MKIKIKISGGTAAEQRLVVERLHIDLVQMRRWQRLCGKPKAAYKIKATACRGVKTAGWED